MWNNGERKIRRNEENMKINRKIKCIGKVVISGALVLSLVMGNVAFIRAEKTTREESVYVNADANGNMLELTITESLKNKETSEVLEENTYEGSGDKELPVSVDISYELDGEMIAPKDLAGKSGKIKITVSYTNHSKTEKKINGKMQEIVTPFLMATLIVLPEENFSNVKVDNGKIMNEGDNFIVLGFGLPGLADSLGVEDEDLIEKMPEEFTITADAKEFALDSTMTYATADLFTEFDFGDSETFDDIEEGIDTLTDASEELVKGSKQLNNSVGEFKTSFKEYYKGEKGLNKGIKSLAKGGKQLKKGVNGYVSGVNSLATGVTSYVSGTKQILDGNQSLYNAIKGMPGSYKTFSDGLATYTTGVDNIAASENATALSTEANSVSAGISSLNTELTTLESSYESYDTLIANLRTQANSMTDETQKQALLTYADELETLVSTQKQSVTSMKTKTANEGELKTKADAVATGAGAVVTSVKTLSQSSQTLRTTNSQISAGINSVVETSKKLSEGSAKLSPYNTQLTTGAKQLKKAGKSVKSGSNGLVKGMNELKKGSNQLHKATGKISEGLTLMNEGTSALASGMSQFDKEGIQEIETMYEEDFKGLKDRLSALVDCAKEYNSFAGEKDGKDGAVSFVIETEGI